MIGPALGRPAALNQLNLGGGTALLLSIRDRRLRWINGEQQAGQWLAPPGSTMKPLSVLALIELGRLRPGDAYVCPGRLVLNGIHMDCSHPRTSLPMDPSRAIAYSCNCAIAHFAQRFRPGELARFAAGMGLTNDTGLVTGPEASGEIEAAPEGPRLQLQALGEAGIRVTALELALAYRRVAMLIHDKRFAPILEGLEGAVEFGTAQAAQSAKQPVAGKTGTVQTRPGEHLAWFAGFAPSRAAEVVVTVLVPGRSGGGSAAPLARRIFEAHFAGSV
jgi:cell division protein FtsI/penicillin-binding protein 2